MQMTGFFCLSPLYSYFILLLRHHIMYMDTTSKLALIIDDQDLPKMHRDIAQKVQRRERISFDEGVYLYEHGELAYLGVLANYIREAKHGDHTYFNRNFHL